MVVLALDSEHAALMADCAREIVSGENGSLWSWTKLWRMKQENMSCSASCGCALIPKVRACHLRENKLFVCE